MSEFFVNDPSALPPPPAVPTSFVTNNGTAVPAVNILIVHGVQSTENNNNGIIAKGGVVGTGTSNEVDIVLTNRVTASVSTANATPTAISTFSLGSTPGCFTLDGTVTGFNSAGSQGLGIFYSAAVKTSGAAATIIGVSVSNEFKDVAAWDITVTASGNNLVVTVIGAAGTNIDWDSSYIYRFVS